MASFLIAVDLNYCSLAKERPGVELLTRPSKKGVGALSSVSAYNHERVPMSCLQLLIALKIAEVVDKQ